MGDQQTGDSDIPLSVDFSNGVRGLHHIPADATVLTPARPLDIEISESLK